MLFNSKEFLLFFPVVTLLYFLLPHKFRWIHLLLASCIFYCAFIPIYILILVFTIIIDYFAGIVIEKSEGKKRKRWLVVSIVSNVGILAVFKYFNFFIDNINEILGQTHATFQLPLLDIVLPIGLSFHTFQAMSYTIEVYRGNFKAERHFGIYALYVMFYPQLVAGPIERPQNVLPQFREVHRFDASAFHSGIRLMLWGLFKKVVIADRLSIYVDAVYDHTGNYSSGNYILATFFFTIQIYCDFSGYSDMAIGSARTMGFRLMTNFNRPYTSANIREFWAHWHISLSTWFRDYLYIPLGGNRVPKARQIGNTIVVFLVSGFWHGANWTFVIWGALHAFYNSVYLTTRKFWEKMHRIQGWKIFAILFTFVIVAFAWVFFRAKKLSSAFILIKGCFVPTAKSYQTIYGSEEGLVIAFVVVLILFMLVIESRTDATMKKMDQYPVYDLALGVITLTLIICFGMFTQNSFIYFQF